jgi:hypothetical protein
VLFIVSAISTAFRVNALHHRWVFVCPAASGVDSDPSNNYREKRNVFLDSDLLDRSFSAPALGYKSLLVLSIF